MDLGYCIKPHQLHHRGADTQRRSSSHNLKENDADNNSTISNNSQFFNGFDTETMPAPVSVRDMIKRYNSASKMGGMQPIRRQSQFTLSSAKSSFFGVNNFSSNKAGDQSEDENAKVPFGCRRCNSVRNVDSCSKPPPQNCGIIRSASLSSDQSRCKLLDSQRICNSEGNPECNAEVRCSANENKEQCAALMKESPSCPRPSVDSLDEVSNNCQPVEASYQSKTTIAKTSSGVRIIIDIFFDQEQNVDTADVIGSRVETDIPQSRILSEFQQQTMQAARLQN